MSFPLTEKDFRSTYEYVTLRDGTKVPEIAVKTIMMAVQAIAKENIIALYDLVTLCTNDRYIVKNRTHSSSQTILKKYGFLHQGSLRKNIKEVVLNGVHIEGSSAQTINPILSKRDKSRLI